LTPAPLWLAGVVETVPPEPGHSLGAPIAFLTHFLPQAEEAWREEHVCTSGPFATTVRDQPIGAVAARAVPALLFLAFASGGLMLTADRRLRRLE
jgi:hypothetical protein